MKKYILFLALAAAVICSCGKPDNPENPDNPDDPNTKPQEVAVTSVTLDKTALELTEGETATLVATVQPDNATKKTVTWTSSDAAIAAVDNKGKVTAVAEGNATITAKAGEQQAVCSVTVKSDAVDAGDPEGLGNENEDWPL